MTIDFRPDESDLAEAVRLVRFGRDALHAAKLKLDDAGYTCETLSELYAGCAGLIADWAGRRYQSIPEYIVRSAIEYRHRHGRSY
ncbi:hypothetical protein NKI80_22290 [Mesorhizobium sp. M0387]|uniref:hypothetical protein n=1 Tax=Mesorhizobium sp. M0387 TaxID=2956940 RepID=UPI0033396076